MDTEDFIHIIPIKGRKLVLVRGITFYQYMHGSDLEQNPYRPVVNC